MHADAAAGSDEDIAVVKGIFRLPATLHRLLKRVHRAPSASSFGSPRGFFRSLNSLMKASNLACCCKLFMPGGRVVSALKMDACVHGGVLLRVPSLIRWIAMPSLSQKNESLERLSRRLGKQTARSRS